MKEEILEYYFVKKMKSKDISDLLNVSSAYITKIIKSDIRYKSEKERRIENTKEKHRDKTIQIMQKKRLKIQFESKADDLVLRKLHDQASMEMSKNKKLSDYAYRNWNTSAYSYNKEKGRFEFREELGRSYDVKKYLKG